jgi:hypothetical protein
VFYGNLKLINGHNSEAELGLHTYTLGINQFADMTNDEWRQYLGLGVINDNTDMPPKNTIKVNRPNSIDWRDEVSVAQNYLLKSKASSNFKS